MVAVVGGGGGGSCVGSVSGSSECSVSGWQHC